ncbi:MAG: hypothetical protein LDLANPLL_01735 [Turneriella sp.]|nr:hypothetical protein [Turneriella sp.]
MSADRKPMPEIEAASWLNSPPLTIEKERGKVILIYAFQMLCPGCVTHASPQVQKVRDFYGADTLTVIGLHSVFEHHEAMREESLKAYLYEFKYTFPVAIDTPGIEIPIPQTMAKLGLRGTPSILLVDKKGRIARHFFGQMDDLYLGTEIGLLLAE